jgi:pimeloyl-ACP methyl ester carboxylesterase
LFVLANNVRTHYELAGPADAPVVVLVHGLTASLRVWKGQAERLSRHFRVLRYDLRSHGQSEAIDRACTRSDLATDLIALLDALGIERAALVGHSAGGVVVMHAALEHPARVWAVGLVGTSSECNDKTSAWYAEVADKARNQGVEAAMRTMGIPIGSASISDGRGFSHLPLAMRTLNEDPLTERLRELRVPAWIVVGEKDFLGVGGSVILSRAIAGSKLEIVAERGHGIFLEDPDWFCEHLEGFLSEALEGEPRQSG